MSLNEPRVCVRESECARFGGEKLQKVEGVMEGRERVRGRSRAWCPFSHMGTASTMARLSLVRPYPHPHVQLERGAICVLCPLSQRVISSN